MRFELARLFLLPTRQMDAFEPVNRDGSRMSREDWLRLVFGTKVSFIHRGAERLFARDEAVADASNRIVARIGRKTLAKESDPHRNLKEFERERWNACLVLIDPTDHPDGQKVAIEQRSDVGSGFANFKSLVDHINDSHKAKPYHIELNPISEKQSFWNYVDKNKGEVTSITLSVALPNMFGGSSSFEEDAKRLRDREGARRLKETIENEDGLNPDTERMREAVDYTTKGGGIVKARSKRDKPYDSRNDKKVIIVNVVGDNNRINIKAEALIRTLDEEKIAT